ncbi:MAG: hypothetical protein LBD70_03835, partial [Bifidobacteriaceae bacterium]|nr:hypothetical protein [Bifidobacteriaceae bacterium]
MAPRRAAAKIAVALLGVAPGIVVALCRLDLSPFLAMAVFGLAIWCAATLLGWAAEAAEMDITGAFAMALLAIVAILPEYAVDVLLAFTAGRDPSYEALASANMNGATRLLIGLALPLVVLVGIASRRRQARRRTAAAVRAPAADAAAPPADAAAPPADAAAPPADAAAPPARVTSPAAHAAPPAAPAPASDLSRSAFFDALPIPRQHFSIMFFLVIAAALGAVAPLTAQIHASLGAVMIALFAVFLWHTSRGEVGEPDLVGVAAFLGARPKGPRRLAVAAFFGIAAATIA